MGAFAQDGKGAWAVSKDAELLRAIGLDEFGGRLSPLYMVGIPVVLGLDCDPAKWTVEHDANFARYVWPWLRHSDDDGSDIFNPVLEKLGASLFLDGEGHMHDKEITDTVYWVWMAECSHPGPTMCKAIYAVLVGEGK